MREQSSRWLLPISKVPVAKAESYRHEEETLLRPDVWRQAQFKKRKPSARMPK